MCPRTTRKKVHVSDPNTLIPELPSPNDLKPFPTQISIDFTFHKTCVRSISVSGCGRYLASGDEDHNLVVWEVPSARIIKKYKLENKVVDCVEWAPLYNSKSSPNLLAVTNEEHVYIINPNLSSKAIREQTALNFENWEKQYDLDVKASSDTKEKFVKWTFEND